MSLQNEKLTDLGYHFPFLSFSEIKKKLCHPTLGWKNIGIAIIHHSRSVSFVFSGGFGISQRGDNAGGGANILLQYLQTYMKMKKFWSAIPDPPLLTPHVQPDLTLPLFSVLARMGS